MIKNPVATKNFISVLFNVHTNTMNWIRYEIALMIEII